MSVKQWQNAVPVGTEEIFAKTIGVQRPGGYFAERISAHPRRVFKLPDTIEDAVGSMVEPTAVAVHANHRGMVDTGSKVVVAGGGTIGLLIAQTATAFGAAGVVVNEPIAERRDLAKNIGISWVCNPLDQDPVAVVRDRISVAPMIGKILPLDG